MIDPGLGGLEPPSDPFASSVGVWAQSRSARRGRKDEDSRKKAHDGSKYATATTEAEFHAAVKRGLDVEMTRELAEQIGVPMDEDVGTVAEIDQARDDPYN